MVSFFKWHINFCWLFNAKAILLDEQEWYYSTYSREDRVNTFPKSISPKVSVLVWVEFNLVYFKAAVQHVNPYATRAH